MDRNNGFRENFKQLRTEQQLSQQQLAQILNISYKTISHWETGYTEPSIDQLLVIAEYFNITLDDLIGKD